jgi:hypothetical protein
VACSDDMSYPGYQGYSGNYATSSSNHGNTYGTERSPSTASAPSANSAYQTPNSQQQYGSSGYQYGGRSQSSYADVNGNVQNYSHTGWKEPQAQQPAYDYQRSQSHSSYAHTSANTQSQNGWYGTSTQPQAPPSTQALSNLAYASGLDARGQHSHDDRISAMKTHNSENSDAAQSNVYGHARVQSPAYGRAYQSSNPQPPQTSQSEQRPNSSHPSSTVSVAAALAGAVNRRISNSPQQPYVPAQQAQASASPSTSSMNRSTANIARTQNQHSTAFDGTVRDNADTQSQPPQLARPQAKQNPNRYGTTETHRYAHSSNPAATLPPPSTQTRNYQTGGPNEQPRNSSQYNVAPAGQPEKTHNTVRSPLATTNNISPLSNFPQRSTESATAMPGFIDPTQVFNPYHKEHERQKREEADRAKRASTEASDSHKAVQAKESNTRPVTKAITAATSVSKQQASKAANNAKSAEPQSGSTVTERKDSGDTDMAAEMKAMIERMREWKTKDPSLFQKLWDDMKKGPATSQALRGQTPAKSPQLAQVTPQQTSQPQSSQLLQPAASQLSPSIAASRSSNSAKTASRSKRHWDLTMVVENNPEGLPDLGRFPAERRNRRTNKEIAEGKAKKEEPKRATETPPAAPNPAAIQPKQDEKLSFPTQATAQSPAAVENMSASPPAQPLPPQNASGGTIWPEAKRKALAEAAQRALMGLAANEDKSITAAEIHALLEQNPSYIELCAKLEAKGFVFHRGQFARFLLNNVPDLASPTQSLNKPLQQPAPPKPVPPQIPQEKVTPHNHFTPGPVSSGTLHNGYPPPNKSSFISYRVPPSAPTAPPPRSTPSRPLKARLGVPSPIIPAPTPGSKEAKARKRDFSELVDLTQLSDDEDYVMPSKKVRSEESPEKEVFQIRSDIPFGQHSIHPSKIHPFDMQRQPYSSSQQTLFGPPGGTASLKFDPQAQPLVNQLQSQVPPQPSQSMPQKSRHLLAKPINKAEALRKSYYDPKTVARDILIAAGRHPGEHPLNAHLAGLLGTHIDLDSDLRTFDWDTVDPGGPPMPVVEVVDIPAGPPRWKLGDRVRLKGPMPGIFDPPSKMRAEDRVKLTERGEFRPEKRQEVDYDKSNGKEDIPDIQTSLAKLSSQTKALLQDSSKPQRPAHKSLRVRPPLHFDSESSQPEKPAHQPSRLRQSLNAEEESSKQSNPFPQPARRRLSLNIEEDSFKPQSLAQKLSRPRQSLNVDDIPQSPTRSLSRREATPHQPNSTTPVVSLSPSSHHSHHRGPGRPRKPSITMELSSAEPQKRRGRPPGSKNKHPTGRPMKTAKDSGVQVSIPVRRGSTSPPSYNIYACQWRKCNADLHNLPTLRKHIARVHKLPDDEIKAEGQPCWWKKCRTLERKADAIVSKVTFNSTSDWLEHVESDHLHPLGMKLGDGPSSAQTGKPKDLEFLSKYFYHPPMTPASHARTCSHTDPQTLARDRALYLSDDQGRAVTAPSTKATIGDYPPDTLILSPVTMNPESNIPNRAFSKAHGNEKMEVRQTAIETLLALQRQKERVGPGLDRGGCTLVNKERRETVLDQEGLARVVDGDY